MSATAAVNENGHEILLIVTEQVDAHVLGVGHPIPFTSGYEASKFEAAVAQTGRRCELRVQRFTTTVNLTEIEADARSAAQ